MEPLGADEVAERLTALGGWTFAGDAIHRTFRFDRYMDAIAFINRVAAKAEAADHHPDLRNSYTTVDVSLTTHSAGGVTEKDLALAGEIDQIVGGEP